MRTVVVSNFAEWREQSRELLSREVPSSDVVFAREGSQSLFDWNGEDKVSTKSRSSALRIPKQFVEAAKLASYHRDDYVWNLLYSLAWRLTHGEPDLLQDAADDEIRQFERMQKQVSRDAHKMKAFVRFRKVAGADGERYVAWHRPDHFVVQHVAPFFARRFTDMHWTIFTPDESATWQGEQLSFGEGVPASAVEQQDRLENLWRTYYRSIFNPARIKLKMMKREMPVRHWATLPETRIMPEMLAEAPERVAEMLKHARPRLKSVAEILPELRDLASLASAAEHCQACDLCHRATQTVFGRGSANAALVLVGEQPGDQEDLHGEPFVGPAGQLIRELVEKAGLEWQDLYVTNAVKHFNWERKGSIRLHRQPPAQALSACHDWLSAEVEAVKPQRILCLGALAAKTVLGRDHAKLTKRGEWCESLFGMPALVTWHPAAILRAMTPARQQEMRSDLIAHLRMANSRN
jgi:probable DNA metabolism protein